MSLLKLGTMFAMYAQFQAGSPAATLPSVELPPQQEAGLASWYGDGTLHGAMTANGEAFDPTEPTCAHRSLPFDTVVMIRNVTTGASAWCRINDRGPYGYIAEGGLWGMAVSGESEMAWRGILDMSVHTSRRLGTQEVGLQQVTLHYWETASPESFDLAVWSLNR